MKIVFLQMTVLQLCMSFLQTRRVRHKKIVLGFDLHIFFKHTAVGAPAPNQIVSQFPLTETPPDESAPPAAAS